MSATTPALTLCLPRCAIKLRDFGNRIKELMVLGSDLAVFTTGEARWQPR